MVWNVWTGVTAWPYLLVIGVSVLGICWITSPAQRSRRRRRDARDRIAFRRALRGGGPTSVMSAMSPLGQDVP